MHALRLDVRDEAQAERWDALCAASPMATFLHTRRFLSYHGERFDDRSLVICDDDGTWLGLIPAAVHPNDPQTVVSHPGITYGGVLHSGALRGERMIEALQQAARTWAALGHTQLLYKAVPVIYHQAPAQDDLYALFRLGAVRTRCDLSCTIELTPGSGNWPRSERRSRSIRKAAKQALHHEQGTHHLPALWDVLCTNLASRHEARPVHSLSEITLLAQRFPGHIGCHVARLDDQVVAGVVSFCHGRVMHAQYIAASEAGHAACALDGLMAHLIDTARAQGLRHFDFGISNEDQGRHLNSGLYRFKAEFGGGGTVHEFYTLALA